MPIHFTSPCEAGRAGPPDPPPRVPIHPTSSCEAGRAGPPDPPPRVDLPQRRKLPHNIPSWVSSGAVYFITINTLSRDANHLSKTLGLRWQRDFFDHRLRDDENFIEKAHYVRMNPVRKGLCKEADEWPYTWDDFRALDGGCGGSGGPALPPHRTATGGFGGPALLDPPPTPPT